MYMVKAKTKSGITFELDERIKDDARLMYLLVKMQNASAPMEAGKAMNQLLALIFGDDDKGYAFMEEIASKHDGVCEQEVMITELTEIFEAIKAKN